MEDLREGFVKMGNEEAEELLGALYCHLQDALNQDDSKERLDRLLDVKKELVAVLKDRSVPRWVKDDIGQDMLPTIQEALDQMSENRSRFKLEKTLSCLHYCRNIISLDAELGFKIQKLEEALKQADEAMEFLSNTSSHFFHVGLLRVCGSEGARDHQLREIRENIAGFKKVLEDFKARRELRKEAQQRQAQNRSKRAMENQQRAWGGGGGQKQSKSNKGGKKRKN